MIVAKPGFESPTVGQQVYVIINEESGKPVAVGLNYPKVVEAMCQELDGKFLDIHVTRWIG